MECTIPLQTFELGKVRLGQLTRGQKPLLPITYVDGDIHFNCVTLLLPGLAVKAYDTATGRLSLHLPPATAQKLQGLQDMLIGTVKSQHTGWFFSEKPRPAEELRAGFQSFVDHGVLHLYCPQPATGTGGPPLQPINVYSKGEWKKGRAPAASLVPGSLVRIALRVQGLSFHLQPVTGQWTGKYRIQHKIVAMIF